MRDITLSERRVVLLMAQGLPRAEVAAAVGCSPKTIDFHVYQIYRMWGIRQANPVKLVREAIKRGILAYDEQANVVERAACDSDA